MSSPPARGSELRPHTPTSQQPNSAEDSTPPAATAHPSSSQFTIQPTPDQPLTYAEAAAPDEDWAHSRAESNQSMIYHPSPPPEAHSTPTQATHILRDAINSPSSRSSAGAGGASVSQTSMYAAPYAPPSGLSEDGESLTSNEDDFDRESLDPYEGFFHDRKGGRPGRLSQARSSVGSATPTAASHGQPQAVQSATAQGKAKVTPRAPSLVATGRTGSRFRSLSRARKLSDDEPDSFEGAERARSPLPGRQRADDLEDDEVHPIDRGEELIRKRAKDRARLKKEQNRLSRAAQGDILRRTSYNPALSDADPFELGPDRHVSSSSAGVTPGLNKAELPGYGFPRSVSRVRQASRSVSRGGGPKSDDEDAGTPVPGSPLPFLPIGNTSWNPRVTSGPRSLSRSSSRAEGDEGVNPFGFGSFAPEPEQDPSVAGTAEVPDEDEDSQDGNLEEEAGEGEMDDDESDSLPVDGEVEYTLKDRQDAFNVEHPFGLPIWKPALYKKSRSVARNAEAALHATPLSSTAHFSPGNLLWTVFFGSILFVVCAIVAALLFPMPWGGSKYGRVVWELGTYLFSPFGKYVEGWTDGPHDEDDEDGDSEQLELDDDDDDLEATGGTFRASGSSSRGNILDHAVFDGDNSASLPDEPQRRVASDSPASTLKGERSKLLSRGVLKPSYGSTRSPTIPEEDSKVSHPRSASDDTIGRSRPHDFSKDPDGQHQRRVRALGRVMFWILFYFLVAPLMLFVCVLCWAIVFTIPMAKLLWVLFTHLHNEPLSLHFRSPPKYISPPASGTSSGATVVEAGEVQYPLRAGQRAPPVSRKSVAQAKAQGRLFGPRSTVLLCTYRAAGLQYYKYTIDGVNIIFINLLSLVFFAIADFWIIRPYVEHHHIGGLLGFVAGEAFVFGIALLSVIPLSYFIGMAVASISAQSSIGMGAVINATFGSIIEIILYGMALTQRKAELVEGSIVGSILAGVLLMPGVSMIGGAVRRKEQRFNAKSAGVTSTMLIMAIIGILTPTLFYEIYGSFQLSCTDCDPTNNSTSESCRTCYYEHLNPAEDPFYQNIVRRLSYWCAALLVFSYVIGLWFSLRTHASQIWQNAAPVADLPKPLAPLAAVGAVHAPQQLPAERQPMLRRIATPRAGTLHEAAAASRPVSGAPGLELPPGTTVDHLNQALSIVVNKDSQPTAPRSQSRASGRGTSHAREHSQALSAIGGAPLSSLPTPVKPPAEAQHHDEGGHGGHDAPNWSRTKSASVLLSCTALYAIIAEILVDVVDVVLDGSGIPEKFLGVTLFALVPNTTEFMNAISFAINGNIALSMEIGSAYALQVCLIQAPAMLIFSGAYASWKGLDAAKSFTLVFPRWDLIAIIFSVFLLTYTYIEARANYYRGSILFLAYLVLMGGFGFAPAGRDTETDPLFWGNRADTLTLSSWETVKAIFNTLFTK